MLQRTECVYFLERMILETSLEKREAGTLAFVGESAGKVEPVLKYLSVVSRRCTSYFLGVEKTWPGGNPGSSNVRD